jgi:large subunit ribosomal protein L15
MNLSQLKPPKGQKHKNQRIGQGMGSGRGKYSGRGAKGAKSISGYSRMRGFEGGQMPLHRRLPKRGFTNIFRKEYAVVNLGLLDRLEGDSFDPGRLLELGVIHKLKEGVKILGSGELKRKILVKAHQFSKSALEKIQAAGGTAEVIGGETVQAQKPAEPKPAAKPKPAATPKPEAPAAAEKPVKKPRQPKAGPKEEK